MRKVILGIAVFFLVSTILMTFIYKFFPVYVTPIMVIRSVDNLCDGEKIKWNHHWVPINEISKYLPQAVVASEDNLFLDHGGFDFKEIKKAQHENLKRKKPRGASTISQQTAKNVFLWPKSSWIRKGFEVYFTFLIEKIWGKKRIMEVYLNSIEMGRGIYGAEAVARENFGKSAKKLTQSECALIAATLPNPRRFNSAKPSPYILARQQRILYLMGCICEVEFD